MSDKHKHKDKDRKRRDAGPEQEREAKRARHEAKGKSKKARAEDSDEDYSEDSSSADRQRRKKAKDAKQKSKEDLEREAHQSHRKDRDREKDKEKDKDRKRKEKEREKAGNLQKARSSENQSTSQVAEDKKDNSLRKAKSSESQPVTQAKVDKKEKKKDKKEKDDKKEGKKEKKEDKKSEKKDAKKDKAENASSSDNEGKPDRSGGAAEAESQLDKKLKAWQDDELEVESGDEAQEPTKLQTLSSVAARSMGGQAAASEQVAEPEEVDPLDAFMAELAKSEETETPGAAAAQGISEGMGVMEASRVKTISLEEVEALMGVRKDAPAESTKEAPADQDAKAAAAASGVSTASVPGGDSGTSSSGSNSKALSSGAATQLAGTGGSSSSSSRHPQPAGAEQGDAGDEDDKFHAAFIAEIRRLRESESAEFQAASTFVGAREGYVFKRGPAGLGYYRDTVGAAIAAQRSVTAAAAAPPAPLPSDDVARGSQPKAGEAKAGEADSMKEDGGGDANKDGEDESEDSEDEEDMEEDVEGKGQEAQDLTSAAAAAPQVPTPVESTEAQAAAAEQPLVKVVETKKEKRRKRREAKEAEARAKDAAAKVKAREGFGHEEEEERMESDPDRSEDSSEEEQESYFDLVKRFTTKKTLPAVDHSTIDYVPFRKNIYIQVNEITNMKDHEVEDMRQTNGDIHVRGKHCPRPIKSFLQCGLPAKIMRIMEKRDYEQPFPIQMQAIPALMCGRDVIGVAQTGSGKTLAYLLPAIRHVLDQPKLADGDGPIVFVIAPTRELALQIQREANVFCKAVGLVSVCAYGGGPMGEQLSALKKGAEVLVGTPGRLIGVLTTSNGKITNLRRVSFMVLDEADRMFDMGFEPQIGMFLQSTRPDKQVAMFSATLPTHVEALARTVLKRPLEISVGERNTAATNVTQFVEVLEESQKFYRLLQLLGEWHEHGSIIIFVHQQKDVDEMFTELLKYGYPPLALHGGQDQHDRDFTLQDFKDGVSNILIATSVAARGIDVKSMILVINFKVPDHLEDYIHRIGRTGRAGKPGFAYTFIQPDEGDHAQDMVDALRQCNQEVPEKLKKLAEEHQVQVNSGQASKRRRWGGFGGKGFKYDNSEKSRQQKDRAKAKKDLLIGENADPEDEEEEKKLANDDREKDKKEDSKKVEIVGTDPVSTAAGAAQIAAKMQADMAKAASAKVAPPAPLPVPTPVPDVPAATSSPKEAAATGDAEPSAASAATGSAAGKAEETPAAGSPTSDTGEAKASMPPPSIVPAKAGAKAGAKARALAGKRSVRLTDEELEEQALKMAEDTLKNLDEEVREKQLPALTLKLKERLKKAEQEKELSAGAPAVPPPPPKFKEQPSPLMQALPMVPGVLGDGSPTQPNMVTRTMEQLQASMAKPGAGTAHLAEAQAALLSGVGPNAPPGMAIDELEINDYPTIARQKISHKEPLLAIEEMTGAKCQVKGQYFTANQKLPEGARRLYVEVVGPTVVSVQKAKQEVRRMMEALSIRTLNIPGVSRAVMGTPGRYDPAVGK
mmetsp:Transcript_83979/g.246261  ORF Transcript_83979/g.246261 Transcript_83979/m.246261 type:complete len:1529 (+) Transcript_83979:240-4826(+)